MAELKTPSIDSLRKALIASLALILAFGIGFIPSWWSARFARAQKERLEEQLSLFQLERHLGMASFEVNRNNFASATEHLAQFFAGLEPVASRAETDQQKLRFEAILVRRDQIMTDLARADQSVRDAISTIYAQFSAILDSSVPEQLEQ